MIKLLDRKAVRQRTGLAVPTIYLYMKNGEFPKPIKVGKRGVRWIEEEVDNWIAKRVASSRSKYHLLSVGIFTNDFL